jgi:hypothetical protein
MTETREIDFCGVPVTILIEMDASTAAAVTVSGGGLSVRRASGEHLSYYANEIEARAAAKRAFRHALQARIAA